MVKTALFSQNTVKKPKEVALAWEDHFNSVKAIPEGFKTARNVAIEVGLTVGTVRIKLNELVSAGKAERIRKSGVHYYKLKG